MAAISRRCSHHLSVLPKILLLIIPLLPHVESKGGVFALISHGASIHPNEASAQAKWRAAMH